MTTLAQVVDGLEAQLETIGSLRVYDHVPGTINLPAVVIQPTPEGDFRSDLAVGGQDITIPLAVLVAVNVPRKQGDIFKYLARTGSDSIFAALVANPSLGFSDVSVNPVRHDPIGAAELGGKICWGATVTVQVMLGG